MKNARGASNATPAVRNMHNTQAGSSLQRVRRLVLYMVLALGACTLITAALLLMHTLKGQHTDGLSVLPSAWGGSSSSSSSGGTTRSRSRQSSGSRSRSSSSSSSVAALLGLPLNKALDPASTRPLSKELDPDFVEPSAKATATYAKKCPAGCEKNGNCNAEEGRCECPFGYVGPTCSEPLFPACKLAANATDMHCGEGMPRSCECFRQCRNFYCSGGKGTCEIPRDPWYVRCFERMEPADAAAAAAGRGSAQVVTGSQAEVWSDIPEEWEEQKGLVRWYRGIRSDMSRERLTRYQATKVYKFACVNQCLGRGDCRGGFCHCTPPYWGKDCSRSKAFPPHNAHTAVAGLKVYVYELPTHLAFDREQYVGFPGHDPTYIAYKGFTSGLLHDWAVRTENAWEANLFFVPALTYSYSSNLGDVVEHLRRVMAWVNTAHPFFNRTGGRDHFVWLPNDRGACWIEPLDPLIGNLIKVVHFGFHQIDTNLPNDFQIMPDKGAACFAPERDIVAAPYSYRQEAIANETYHSFDPSDIPRERLLFFAGTIHLDEPDYSGGVRQELWRLHQAKKLGSNVLITDKTKLPNFVALVRSSKFCFAPWGHGWGNRLGLYMVMGCVPVIIQDGVYQPFHDLLPYHKFSITLPKARLGSITQVLSSVSDADYIKLRHGLQQYWPAFVWHPLAGGQAYNYTLQSLEVRLRNHKAGLF